MAILTPSSWGGIWRRGKAANEETAAIGGGLAAQEAQPLAKNGFKMQIVRALVKRAVLGGYEH